MRKFSSFLFALFLAALLSISVTETKALGITKSGRHDMAAPLLAPFGLKLINLNSNSINFGWQIDPTSVQDGFQVAYVANGSSVITVVPTNFANGVTSANIQGLMPNTGYTFYVYATLLGVNSPYSAPFRAITFNVPPGQPVLNLLTPSNNQVTLNWSDNSTNENGFIIYRDNTEVARTGPNVTSYTNTGLLPRTNYRYRVAAYDSTSGNAGFNLTSLLIANSNSMDTQTLANQPSTPVGLTVTGTTFSTISISWADFDGDFNRDFLGFKVERSYDNNNWNTITTTGRNPVYTDGTFAEGTTAYYRIRAYNNGGSSDPTPSVMATTLKHVKPDAVAGLTAVKNPTFPQTKVNLSWLPLALNDITKKPTNLDVYRSTDDTNYSLVGSYAPDQVVFIDSAGLKPKTKYYYFLKATSIYGQSDPSNVAVVTTDGPPIAPTNLTAQAGVDALGAVNIALNWKDNADDEWAYFVEMGTDTLNLKLVATILPNSTSFVSIPLTENTKYYYRVRANNTYGFSKYSNIASATTNLTKAPNAPFFLTSKATALGQVTLNWSDDANNEAGYYIERSTDGTTYTQIGQVVANVITYVDASVSNATTYYYRVRAFNSIGKSAYSNVTSVKSSSSSLESVTDSNWKVYPNPTSDLLKITLPTSISNEAALVRIINGNNQEIVRTTLKANNNGELELDMSSLPEGSYTVNIQMASQVIAKRIVKN